MENESTNTAPTVTTAPPPKKRRFLRASFVLIACVLFTAFITLMLTRERLRAQYQMARAQETRMLASQISNTQRAGMVNSPNQTYAPVPDSLPVPSSARMVPVTTVDSKTGEVTTKMMAVPASSSPNEIIGTTTSDSFRHLELEIQQLANKSRNYPLDQRQTIVQTIAKKLDELFEARHNEQTEKIKKLAAELQQSQAMLDRRMELKSKIIDRRLKELTGQPDELNWNAPPLKLETSATAPSNNSDFPAITLGGTQPVLPIGTLPELPSTPVAPITVPMPNPTMPVNPSITPPSNAPHLGHVVAPDAVPMSSVPPTMTRTEVSTTDFANSSPLAMPLSENPLTRDGNEASKNEITGQSEQSFLQLGLKLKKLSAAEAHADKDSKEAKQFQKEIEEMRELWDFEKTRINGEIDRANSELTIVKRQLTITEEDYQFLKTAFENGRRSRAEVSESEFKKSAVELQLNQVEGKLSKLRQAIDWINKLERDTFGVKEATY